MRPGRKTPPRIKENYQKYYVKLTSEERQYLEKLILSGSAPARKLQRARILLKSDCSEGGPNWSYEAICDAFDVNSMTVTNFRKAFTEGGLEKAINRKKPEREYQNSLDRNAEAHLIALACGAAPDGAEIEFGVLIRQCLSRRIPDKTTLKKEVKAWQIDRNTKVVKVDWRFTTADPLIKLKHLYPVIHV